MKEEERPREFREGFEDWFSLVGGLGESEADKEKKKTPFSNFFEHPLLKFFMPRRLFMMTSLTALNYGADLFL